VDDAARNAIAGTLATFSSFRGHLTLDERGGRATVADMQNAMHSWRIAFAEKELNRT
jgi:hypothetical protein